MADKKVPYSWPRVKPGNIISFRYKTKATGKIRMHSILVLNPKFPAKGKGKSRFHLIGIKLEESNIQQLRMTKRELLFFERIGELKSIRQDAPTPGSGQNLYRFKIDQRFILNDIRGVKQKAYDLISRSLNIQGKYRTYDYFKAKRSAVYLEPIRVYTEVEGSNPEDIKIPKERKELINLQRRLEPKTEQELIELNKDLKEKDKNKGKLRYEIKAEPGKNEPIKPEQKDED